VPSFVLNAVTTSLFVCVVKLFIWYVALCCLCVCVPDILVSDCLRRQVVYLVCGCMLSVCLCVPDVLVSACLRRQVVYLVCGCNFVCVCVRA
jgi:hypothetical protein